MSELPTPTRPHWALWPAWCFRDLWKWPVTPSLLRETGRTVVNTALKPAALTGCVALREFNSLSLSFHIWKMATHKDATSSQSHYQNQVR